MASTVGSSDTLMDCCDGLLTRNSSSVLLPNMDTTDRSIASLRELALKQRELIEMLTRELLKLQSVRQSALKLHEYYYGKAISINKMFEGEGTELCSNWEYMDILEANARRFLDKKGQHIESLKQQLKEQTRKQAAQQKKAEGRLPIFVDRIVERPVILEVVKEVEKEVVRVEYRDRQVEKVVYVDKEILVDRPVERIVERVVELPPKQVVVEKVVYVGKPIFVTKQVQAPPKIVYIDRPAPSTKQPPTKPASNR